MHPEAKNGEERKSEKIRKAKCNSDPIKSFVQDTADKVGISSSTISFQIRTAKNLIQTAKEIPRTVLRNQKRFDAYGP